ncbi:cupin domain-containing protein [Curvivirga sp.]|uniref:cupin domain-containing protein n=1 Tax=Curvivirga sp. TaxID=2856848 RepID=UPI003B5A25BD
MTPKDIIEKLQMQPHPEGGWYVETYREQPQDGGRGASTCIYYLLEKGQSSHWHKVTDADEVWHWYAGEALLLSLSTDGHDVSDIVLGPDLLNGQQPQGIVPADVWQVAKPLGDWVLVGCTVAPAFDFNSFVMAPDNWVPGKDL